jgi:hypothetical protein
MKPNNCPPKRRVHTLLHIAKASLIIILCYINQKQSETQSLFIASYLTTSAEYQTNMTCNKKRDVKIIN